MEYSYAYNIEVYGRSLYERLEPRRAVLQVAISRIEHWDRESTHDDMVYNCRFFFPSLPLHQPDEARVAVFGMLDAAAILASEEDLERIGDAIASQAAMIAAEARPSNVGLIRTYLPEPLWVFEPEDGSGSPASTSIPWQRLQEAEAIDDVLVLDEGDLGIPAMSSAIKNLDRKSYDGEGRNWCREQACAICIEDFEQGARLCRMPCRHAFHEGCLARWLKQSRLCPLCRFSL